jgi:lysophospholipase
VIPGDNIVLVFDYFTSSDNLSIRYGIWKSAEKSKKGSVILLGGRKEFIEKYAETIDELKQRCFDVYSMDWRGQGMSTRMLSDRHKGFVRDFKDYTDDLSYFIHNIVKPTAVSPLIILAHSMGGHITLRFIHDHPQVVDKAVLTSPMIDISIPYIFRRLVRSLSRLAAKNGLGHYYSIGSRGYSVPRNRFEGNQLTSDYKRFMVEQRAIESNPDLALGGVTYGWLAAAFDSIDRILSNGYAEKILSPVLIVSAERDGIVSESAQKSVCSRMGRCRFVSIPESLHEILMENDGIRNIFWNEFDKFACS